MDQPFYTAFDGQTLVARGSAEAILPELKARFDIAPVLFLIFDDHTGQQVDFDLEGSPADVLARVAAPKSNAGPGRPKLGVVSREVSLLPRHWEWLAAQPGGSSGAIRRLVDQARKLEPEAQEIRRQTDALYRFLSAMAGNLQGFEEAIRALYASDRSGFEALIESWTVDIREHARRLYPGAAPRS